MHKILVCEFENDNQNNTILSRSPSMIRRNKKSPMINNRKCKDMDYKFTLKDINTIKGIKINGYNVSYEYINDQRDNSPATLLFNNKEYELHYSIQSGWIAIEKHHIEKIELIC